MASQAHLFNEPSTSEPPMKKLKTSTPRTQNLRAKSFSSVGKRSSSITSSKHSIWETSTASTQSVGTSSSSRQTASTLLTPFSISPPKRIVASSSNKGKGKRVASPGLRPPPLSPVPTPVPSKFRMSKPLPSRSGQKVGRRPTETTFVVPNYPLQYLTVFCGIVANSLRNAGIKRQTVLCRYHSSMRSMTKKCLLCAKTFNILNLYMTSMFLPLLGVLITHGNNFPALMAFKLWTIIFWSVVTATYV